MIPQRCSESMRRSGNILGLAGNEHTSIRGSLFGKGCGESRENIF